MICEIVSIGDELLIGQTVNTNATYLAKHLTELGHEVRWATTVGDHADDLKAAFQNAMHRSQIVIATGGLGPTHDDITKKVACEYFESELIFRQDILERLKKIFESRGIKLAESNRDQAMVPEKAQVLDNPVGTAPGLLFEKSGKKCFILPGVPSEMKAICMETVFPLLKDMGRTILFKTVRTTGIPESTLFEKLDNLSQIEQFAKVAFLPKYTGVDIRLTVLGEDRPACEKRLENGTRLVYEKVGKYVFAEDGKEMEEVVADLLTEKGKTVAVAESCTGGLLANKLTNISGSSAYFDRGIVSYSNAAKMENLNVPEETLSEFGAVSSETAIAMANGIRTIAGSDFALSTTGIAGPTGGTESKPVGLVYIGMASEKGSYSKKYIFFKDRLANKERTVQAALDLLRKELLTKPRS